MGVSKFIKIGLWGSVALICSCAHQRSVLSSEESAELVRRTQFSLGSRDVVEVRVFGEKELSGVHQISSNGTLRLPLVGIVKVSGLAPQEASELIAAKYGEKYLRNPEVSIFVKQFNSRKIYVLGEVGAPGSYAYEENMSLIAIIAKAGGITPLAAGNRTIITRIENGETHKLKAKVADMGTGDAGDIPVFPGDIIFVPQSLF